MMKRIINIALKMKIWKDTRGQDLIEYALMAGFVAVAGSHHARRGRQHHLHLQPG